MGNELKIRKTKLDYLNLINLNLNRQHWGEIYTLYTLNDITINCVMCSYNFEVASADFKLIPSGSIFDSNWDGGYITYWTKHCSLKEFNTLIITRIIRLINDKIDYTIKCKAKEIYQDLYIEGDTSEEFFEEHGYLDEYQKIIDLDSEFEDDFLTILSDSILEELNQEYENKIKDYCLKNTVEDEDLNLLLKELYEDLASVKNDS